VAALAALAIGAGSLVAGRLASATPGQSASAGHPAAALAAPGGQGRSVFASTASRVSTAARAASAPAARPAARHGARPRLALRAPGRARVAARIKVSVTDTSGAGGVAYHLCVDPPAAASSCRRTALMPGQRTATTRIGVDSPGRWLLVLGTGYGERLERTVDVQHPGGHIRLLATGDSEIQEVDTDLATGLAADRVRVTSDARVGTGISKVALFDWVHYAAHQVAAVHPDVTVMFIGANDGFALKDASGKWVQCCGAAWVALFARRTELMMSSYLRGGRGRVYWFTLPIARDAGHAEVFRAVNRAYLMAAAHFSSGVELIRADQIFTPGGRYTQTILYHGHSVDVRAPDGIHLSPAGAQIAAAAVIAAMRHDRLLP